VNWHIAYLPLPKNLNHHDNKKQKSKLPRPVLNAEFGKIKVAKKMVSSDTLIKKALRLLRSNMITPRIFCMISAGCNSTENGAL